MILEQAEPGILLAGSFKKGSPSLKKEVAAFEARLAELQKKMKLGGFISAVKTVKNVTTVKVIGVMMTPPATTENRAPRPSAGGWASKGSKDVTALLNAELGGWSKK